MKNANPMSEKCLYVRVYAGIYRREEAAMSDGKCGSDGK